MQLFEINHRITGEVLFSLECEFAWHKNDTIMVQVGCRSFTLQQGLDYWRGKKNRREVMAALDYALAVAKIRGWVG